MIEENTNLGNKITSKISKIIKQNNIKNGVTLFPMLRKEKNKLLIGTMIELIDDDLIKRNKVVRPKYWLLLDINDYNLIEINKTKEKDYMPTDLIPLDKEYDDTFRRKEIELEIINKREHYKKILMENVEKDILKAHKEILDKINNILVVDNEKVNVINYLIANTESKIDAVVNKFIENNKYSAIIYYYQSLIDEILDEYKNTSNINIDKMTLASNILSVYYGKAYGIEYFFNV